MNSFKLRKFQKEYLYFVQVERINGRRLLFFSLRAVVPVVSNVLEGNKLGEGLVVGSEVHVFSFLFFSFSVKDECVYAEYASNLVANGAPGFG